MSEKLSEVFAEYDIEVVQTRRGRNATILETDKGIRELKPLNTGERRIENEYRFKEELFAAGFTNIDRVVKTLENEFISYDRYFNPYVLRHYYEGKELSITDTDDIRTAVGNLAHFHEAGRRSYEMQTSGEAESRGTEIMDYFDIERKYKELLRIKKYMEGSKRREFELTFLREFPYYIEQAKKCIERAGINLKKYKDMNVGYCHGAYDQHSVIRNGDELATICFDKFYVGNQLLDLYHYLRKALEKNKYDFEILKIVLDEYEKYIKLSKEDFEYIYILLLFPEKFYKIGNQYMNSSKCWLSPKLMEKLGLLTADEDKKLSTLFQYNDNYLLHF